MIVYEGCPDDKLKPTPYLTQFSLSGGLCSKGCAFRAAAWGSKADRHPEPGVSVSYTGPALSPDQCDLAQGTDPLQASLSPLCERKQSLHDSPGHDGLAECLMLMPYHCHFQDVPAARSEVSCTPIYTLTAPPEAQQPAHAHTHMLPVVH